MRPSFEREHAIVRRGEDGGNYALPAAMGGTGVPGLYTTAHYYSESGKWPHSSEGYYMQCLGGMFAIM